MNKQVKLRAFSISQDKFSGTVTVSDLLKEVLANSKSSNERRMRLSEDDPKKEEDLISHFNIEKENFIFATMLRIAPGIMFNILMKPYLIKPTSPLVTYLMQN